ncbi:TetR/AcrR family transcriptional regulator [Thalassotalea sp. G2M2-11]|uniref:TetR/AcrR family transcriptional regulator n=1 Tax=Thalassotalea sp. G2M2-11 TaxID=2787627 RepID=UPI0019D1764F|nr:TetR/AcrR family transcriptional regulator [Thalassotalea sp. G2M2-11]
MAWEKSHKLKSKQRILESAAQLFTRYGFEQVSINQIMANAKLTRGAFYSHFSSKSDLYAQAMIKGSQLAKEQHTHDSTTCLATLSQRYLSQAHRDEQLQHLCPLAFLISDINQQDENVKNTYTEVFKRFIDNAQRLTKDENTALQTAALMIGGLALAKAVNDNELSDKLLIACQSGVSQLV